MDPRAAREPIARPQTTASRPTRPRCPKAVESAASSKALVAAWWLIARGTSRGDADDGTTILAPVGQRATAPSRRCAGDDFEVARIAACGGVLHLRAPDMSANIRRVADVHWTAYPKAFGGFVAATVAAWIALRSTWLDQKRRPDLQLLYDHHNGDGSITLSAMPQRVAVVRARFAVPSSSSASSASNMRLDDGEDVLGHPQPGCGIEQRAKVPRGGSTRCARRRRADSALAALWRSGFFVGHVARSATIGAENGFAPVRAGRHAAWQARLENERRALQGPAAGAEIPAR